MSDDEDVTDVDITPIAVPMSIPRTRTPMSVPRTRTQRDHIMQYFAYSEFNARARELAAPFSELAEKIHAEVDSNPERDACLRSLLEARDACLRAAKAQDPL